MCLSHGLCNGPQVTARIQVIHKSVEPCCGGGLRLCGSPRARDPAEKIKFESKLGRLIHFVDKLDLKTISACKDVVCANGRSKGDCDSSTEGVAQNEQEKASAAADKGVWSTCEIPASGEPPATIQAVQTSPSPPPVPAFHDQMPPDPGIQALEEATKEMEAAAAEVAASEADLGLSGLIPGESQTRTLLFAAPGSGDEVDLNQVERWCRRCGLHDVTICHGSAPELRQALTTMSARCQPGDNLVFCVIGNLSGAQPIASVLSAAAPPRVAVVVIADHADSILGIGEKDCDRLGSVSEGRKIISFAASSCAYVRPGLTVVSMLRAVEALSLADGPCGVTCADVFAEMCEQACDLMGIQGGASAQRLLTFKTVPDGDQDAQSLRWPLANPPRNFALLGTPDIRLQAGDANTVNNRPCEEDPRKTKSGALSNSAKTGKAKKESTLKSMPKDLSGLMGVLTGGGALASGPQRRDHMRGRSVDRSQLKGAPPVYE